LVTIDLGFNDIDHCLAFNTVNQPCVTQRLEAIDQQLPQIIATLRAAGSPTMQIVGMDHYDPYLGDYLRSEAGEDFAETSLAVMHRLDDTLRNIYEAAGIPMANVAEAFDLDRTTPTDFAGESHVPLDVARTCELTWDCTSVPYRSKQHPNDAGYRVIAQAVAAAVPS
jgi:lysophospholipase L1-like esterase